MKLSGISWPISILLCLVFTLILIYIIFVSPIIYIPLFFAILFSFLYGLMQSRKGWILGLIQVLGCILGYWILIRAGIEPKKPQEAQFASHILFFPSFVASFLAAFLFGDESL
jgi:hypothetical protein